MILWKRKDDVEIEKIEDKLLVFNSNTFKFYEFNETMNYLWVLLEKPISEETMADSLAGEFDVAKAAALKDVKDIINVLKDKKLIVQTKQ